MKLLVMIFLTLCSLLSVETVSAQIPKDTSGKVYQKEEVDEYVDYKGGMRSFNRLFVSRFKVDIPNKCLFKFVLQCTVETNGEVTDLNFINVETVGLEEADIEKNTKEAIRAFGILKEWIPAVKDGKAVRCVFKLPITMSSN